MPPPSPFLLLLDRRLHNNRDDPGNLEGRFFSLRSRRAAGFQQYEEADCAVNTLELEAILADQSDLSFLTIYGDDEYSSIHAVDKSMILIASAFIQVYPHEVFIIYDANDRSLRMIPSRPRTSPDLPLFRSAYVLIARLHDDDKSYALVYPGKAGEQHVLFLAQSSSHAPWQKTKKVNFPYHLRPDRSRFVAKQVFSSHGRGYWVDLLYGVLYCDCSDVLSDDIDCVDIGSFDLPVGCKQYLGSREDVAEGRAFRTMGPVGNSIKFVSIDGYLEHVDLNDCKVRVWRLMEDLTWAVEYELKLASLWKGEFKGAFVPPDKAPMFPFLSTEEDNVIYFALGSLIQRVTNYFPTNPVCMLRVDLHSKTVDCTRLSKSQSSCMTSHLAISSNAAHKLLGGSCQPSNVEDLMPCPSVS